MLMVSLWKEKVLSKQLGRLRRPLYPVRMNGLDCWYSSTSSHLSSLDVLVPAAGPLIPLDLELGHFINCISVFVIFEDFSFFSRFECTQQNCPAKAPDADIEILGCMAGNAGEGFPGECVTDPSVENPYTYYDTPGYIEVEFRLSEEPVTFYVEFSCCPMDFPGMDMEEAESASGNSSRILETLFWRRWLTL